MRHHPEQEDLAGLAADTARASTGHDPRVAEHVAACAPCAADVEAYRHVRSLALADAAPVPPPAHVWSAIEAELGLAPPLDVTPGTPELGDPRFAARRSASDRAERRPAALRWLPVAAAALIGAVVGATVVGVVVSNDEPEPVLVAEAQLDPLPRSPAARGVVRLLGDGPTSIVEVEAELPTQGGFYEVWIADADLGRMHSLGVLDATGRGRFTLPPGGGLAEFRTIDVSAENLDGDPAHSTISVLRGSLD